MGKRERRDIGSGSMDILLYLRKEKENSEHSQIYKSQSKSVSRSTITAQIFLVFS